MAAKDKRSIASKIKYAAKEAVKQTAKDILIIGGTKGAGTVGKVAVASGKKLGKAMVEKAGTKPAVKGANKVGQKIAESTKAPAYPSGAGKKVSSKVKDTVTTVSKSGRKTTKPAEVVKYTKKPPTEAQRLGTFKALDTKRTKKIVEGSDTAEKVFKPIIGKEVVKKKAAQGTAVVGIPTAYYAGTKKKKKK